jgi:hypothetical protein
MAENNSANANKTKHSLFLFNVALDDQEPQQTSSRGERNKFIADNQRYE